MISCEQHNGLTSQAVGALPDRREGAPMTVYQCIIIGFSAASLTVAVLSFLHQKKKK
jgi:hypothetical protein